VTCGCFLRAGFGQSLRNDLRNAIGDICIALTDVTCTRDAECFDFFDLPCDESYYKFCCVDDGLCDLVNGVSRGQVDACIAALEAATCDEIESDFPGECVGITSRDGPPEITHLQMRRAWGALGEQGGDASMTRLHVSPALTGR